MPVACSRTASIKLPFLPRRTKIQCVRQAKHGGNHAGTFQLHSETYVLEWAGDSFKMRKSQRARVVPPGRA